MEKLNNINSKPLNWFYLNDKGYIISDDIENVYNSLRKKAGIYVYQLITNENKVYVGSTHNLLERLTVHRNAVNKNIKTSPKFYNCVNKNGWNKFRLAVLEFIDLSIDLTKNTIKKHIVNREQYYLDILKPSLNICRQAGSPLGYKHSQEMRAYISLCMRNRSVKSSVKQLLSNHTINKEIKATSSVKGRKGASVEAFDINNNLIKQFPNITNAANYYGVARGTIKNCAKLGNSIQDNYFKIKFEGKILIYDKQYNIINTCKNITKAAKFCLASYTTVIRYIKSGKLWKDKYYFKKTSIK